MALNYKGFKWGNRISSDNESVDRFLFEGLVVPKSPSSGDLYGAAEWLATYAAENAEEAQGWANVIAFLILNADSKQQRSILAEAKRRYAKENGLKVSQVRIKK